MSKCKYWKKCKGYRDNSVTCNQNAGMYYADATEPAGCYRSMEEEEKKWKEN